MRSVVPPPEPSAKDVLVQVVEPWERNGRVYAPGQFLCLLVAEYRAVRSSGFVCRPLRLMTAPDGRVYRGRIRACGSEPPYNWKRGTPSRVLLEAHVLTLKAASETLPSAMPPLRRKPCGCGKGRRLG